MIVSPFVYFRLENYKCFKLEQLISNLKQNSAPDIETGMITSSVMQLHYVT